MFRDISQKQVLVSGPQRSGTRICANMIANDTGLEYIDETDVPKLFLGKAIDDRDQDWDEIGRQVVSVVQEMVDTKEFVLHCPPLMPWIHLVRGALTVITWRSVEEIVRSAKRIDWKKGRQEFEYNKMGYTRFGRPRPGLIRTNDPLADIKYKFWEEHQKEKVIDYLGVEYNSLANHPMWIPPTKRGQFKWNQTSL